MQKRVFGTIPALFVLVMLGSLEVRAEERLDFNIDEGELGNALQSYSVQSGIQHLYTEPQLAQRPAAAVNGAYSAQEALDLLLDDAGVSYRFTDSRTVRLFLSDESEPAAPAAPPPEDEAPAARPPDSEAPSDDEAPGAAAVPAMEEIVVTARKREENLQDVPIAVTALSSEFINEAGLTSVFDVADYTPNLSFRESFGRTFDRPVIRGMSNIIGGANAGVFINGIFVPGSISTAELTNVERVEVIKGPQAALFGRATFAGAINYVIREPGDTLRGRVLATVAQDSERDVSGFLSGPLVGEDLSFLLSARTFSMDGQYDNIGTGGGTAGGLSSDSVNLSLRWEPSERFDATFRVAWSQDDDEHIPFRLQTSELNNCFPDSNLGYYCGEVTEFRDVALNLDVLPNAGLERETLRSNFIANLFLGDLTLTSVTSYTEEDTEVRRDNDFLDTTQNPLIFLPFLSVEAFRTFDETRLKDFSQELRLASDAGERLRWMAGLYYYDETRRGSSASGLALDDPQPIAPRYVENTAVFASLEYDFTQRLRGTAEVRHARDEISTVTEPGSADGVELSESFTSTTPRFTLSYDVNEDLMVYGNVAKGVKPGGLNTALQDASIPPEERARLAGFSSFDEEEAWNYEIGVKGSSFDDRLRWDVAAFYIDWTRQQLSTSEQVERVGSVFSTVPLIVNAGKTEVQGLELTLLARPISWFEAGLSYGYANAEFRRFDDAEQEDLFGDPSARGNNTPNAPEHTAALWSMVSFPVGASTTGNFRLDYLYESTRYAQIHNLAETGATEKVNARLGFSRGPWTATLFGRNIFNDRTPNSVTRFLDPQTLFSDRAFGVALPRLRQYGISLQYDFE
ncbi:TonB-dependent receptor domain-containing protein [Lentisalinibacter sediminis]|uniref:TonB-dependent receptor domain-containing protein n=1 Tax=Lentisalinibacter sediminis TaxID=2992237 RepID=UPI003870A428